MQSLESKSRNPLLIAGIKKFDQLILNSPSRLIKLPSIGEVRVKKIIKYIVDTQREKGIDEDSPEFYLNKFPEARKIHFDIHDNKSFENRMLIRDRLERGTVPKELKTAISAYRICRKDPTWRSTRFMEALGEAALYLIDNFDKLHPTEEKSNARTN